MLEDGVSVATRLEEGHRQLSSKRSESLLVVIPQLFMTLTQTLYLIAADMGLGGCAIGSSNIDLFAKMTGLDFHVEGPVGQFALGRPAGDEQQIPP